MTQPSRSAWSLPLVPDTVSTFGCCLCPTATPPRDDRARCLALLARRGLTCEDGEWAAYGSPHRRCARSGSATLCGRYAIATSRLRRIEDALGIALPELAPRYDVAPTQTAPIVRAAADRDLARPGQRQSRRQVPLRAESIKRSTSSWSAAT